MDPGRRAALTEALRDAVALVLPVECSGCGEPGRVLCEECRAAVAPAVHPADRGGTVVHCALDYDGVARSTIAAFKDGGRPTLAGALGPAMLAAVLAAAAASPPAASPGRGIELVAVPSSRSAYRRRGYSPVDDLLRAGGLRASRVLRVAGEHADQAGLGREARSANVAGGFSVRGVRRGGDRPLAGRRFLIVDDILTTGSTMLAAADAVSAGGGDVVGAAALAETRLRGRRG